MWEDKGTFSFKNEGLKVNRSLWVFYCYRHIYLGKFLPVDGLHVSPCEINFFILLGYWAGLRCLGSYTGNILVLQSNQIYNSYCTAAPRSLVLLGIPTRLLLNPRPSVADRLTTYTPI